MCKKGYLEVSKNITQQQIQEPCGMGI